MVWVLHMKGKMGESICYLLNIGVCGLYFFFAKGTDFLCFKQIASKLQQKNSLWKNGIYNT